MTNVVIQLTLKQLDERIDKAVAKAVAPLHEKIDKLKKDFAELKYSLIYRDMAARVTTTNNIRKTAVSQDKSLADYLKRTARQENSKVNRVKQSLHPIAHGGTKKSSKNYHFQDKNIDKMHRAVYKSKMKKTVPQWTTLTTAAKQEHNAEWKKMYKQENPSVKTYSQTTSKRSSTPSVGSLGRETIYKTVKPLHTVLKKNPQWHANRMGMMARSPRASPQRYP
jgi:hypothetical protein